MTENEFLNTMKDDILDTDIEITMDMKLEDIEEWDSLSLVSFVGMARSKVGKKVDFQVVSGVDTIEDLYNLLTGE